MFILPSSVVTQSNYHTFNRKTMYSISLNYQNQVTLPHQVALTVVLSDVVANRLKWAPQVSETPLPFFRSSKCMYGSMMHRGGISFLKRQQISRHVVHPVLTAMPHANHHASTTRAV